MTLCFNIKIERTGLGEPEIHLLTHEAALRNEVLERLPAKRERRSVVGRSLASGNLGCLVPEAPAVADVAAEAGELAVLLV